MAQCLWLAVVSRIPFSFDHHNSSIILRGHSPGSRTVNISAFYQMAQSLHCSAVALLLSWWWCCQTSSARPPQLDRLCARPLRTLVSSIIEVRLSPPDGIVSIISCLHPLLSSLGISSYLAGVISPQPFRQHGKEPDIWNPRPRIIRPSIHQQSSASWLW